MSPNLTPAAALEQESPREALRVAVVYCVLGLLYIVASSQWASAQAESISEYASFEIYKGIGFVLVTGLGLLLVLRHRERRLRLAAESLAERDHRLSRSAAEKVRNIEAATVAHDLNNTLTVLSGTLALATGKQPTSGLSTQAAEPTPQSALSDCISLTRELSSLLHGENGQKLEPLDAKLLTERVARMVRKHEDGQECRVEVHADGDMQLLGRRIDILQIMLNLTLNAAQATGPEGRIRITLAGRPDEIEICVEDDGPGIRSDEADELFEPGVSKRPGGSGLGLVGVRRAVLRLHGTLSLNDSPLGGARFCVTLPRTPREQDQPVEELAAP